MGYRNLSNASTRRKTLVVHLPQSLYDNLRFPPVKAAKSYLRNELAVVLEISSDSGDGKFFALISLPEFNWKLNRTSTLDDNQFPMLVRDVHVVDGQEKGLVGVRVACTVGSLRSGNGQQYWRYLVFFFRTG